MEHIERTLIIVKPDGVKRCLTGDIMTRLERVGLKLVGLKMKHSSPDIIREHYLVDPEWKTKVGQKTFDIYEKKGDTFPYESKEKAADQILNNLVNFMTAGPVIAAVFEGAHSIELVRKLVGGTEPLSSDVGTIRGDYVMDSYKMADDGGRAIRNIIHASSSVKEAEKEIDIWFDKNELCNYSTVHEKILYGEI